jgi:hypothetical protein
MGSRRKAASLFDADARAHDPYVGKSTSALLSVAPNIRECPLLALSGHELLQCTCLLSGVKRTSSGKKQTLGRDRMALF